MSNISLICRCTAKLHNYVINEAIVVDGMDDIESLHGAPRGLGYLPSYPEYQEDTTSGNKQRVPTGFSVRRTAIVEQIGTIGLCRPIRNLKRNG